MARILVFAGSIRADSFNKKLAAIAAARAAECGGEVTHVDLRDYPMPMYDGDLEASDGIPVKATELRNLMMEHPGWILACPEYNGSITPLLKNTIDWTSRPTERWAMTAAYQGKVAGLISASPGALGGMRALRHVRTLLSGIGVHVVPGEFSVSAAHTAFAEDGSFADPKMDGRLTAAVKRLVDTTAALHP